MINLLKTENLFHFKITQLTQEIVIILIILISFMNLIIEISWNVPKNGCQSVGRHYGSGAPTNGLSYSYEALLKYM